MQIFRLSTARMKINQIPYVIFQATSQFSFKFCITFQFHDTKFLWNVLAELLRFVQKEPIRVQILRLLCNLMKVNSIPHTSFETTRSRFIQILRHFSVPWKITPLYFSGSNLYTVDKTQFSEWLGENPPNSLSQFFLKLCITLQCHERYHFSTFLAETVHDLDKKSPSKCKISDFRLLT